MNRGNYRKFGNGYVCFYGLSTDVVGFIQFLEYCWGKEKVISY